MVWYGHFADVHPYYTAMGNILQSLHSLKYFQGNKKPLVLFTVKGSCSVLIHKEISKLQQEHNMV